MPPARVVHLSTVHHAFDPRIFWKEARSLSRAGFDVHWVVQHDRAERVDGVHLCPLPYRRGRGRRAGLQGAAYRAARALEADVYHFHDPELIPVGYALKRRTGARVVYDMHEDYRTHGPVEGRLLRALERWCFTWVDHVVIANAFQARIPEAAGVPWTYVGNYALPPEEGPAIGPEAPPGGRLELLYTGVLSRGRGLLNMIELARAAAGRANGWTMTWVGVCYRGEDRRQAEARIAAAGLDNRIRRVGWDRYVPLPGMAPHYRAAHAGLVLWEPHPNHVDKIPTKFYEYLQYGLPIVCSDFPLWRDFVASNGCGAGVNPNDPLAVANLLESWLGDPGGYRRLAQAAAAAAPRYRWAIMERRLIDLYHALTGEAPRPISG